MSDADFLEELRQKIFESNNGSALLKGDTRATLVFEKIVERLQEEPDEGDKFEATLRKPRSMSILNRQWKEYVTQSVASIEKRANTVDENGKPRVEHLYRCAGVLRHTDLSDWRGRHRVRIIYDGAGEPVEISLTNLLEQQTTYNRDSFDPHCSEDNSGKSLSDRYEKARRSSVLAHKDKSPKHETLTRLSIQHLTDDTFRLLEQLFKRENTENRSLVPTSEELLEMSLEQVLEHLEKQAQS